MIYGSGKWARLVSKILTKLDLSPILIGSSSDCNYTRDNLEKLEIKKCPVIICSKTKDHITDIEHCLKLEPSIILVEKGFLNAREKSRAKKLCKNIPAFILSQYRFSGVFSELKKYKIGNIIKCDYEWEVNSGEASEWIHHIISLDNYLKDHNKEYYIEEFGTYRIDSVSDFTIKKSDTRNLNVFVETELYFIRFNMGKTNSFEIKSKEDDSIVEKKIFEDEDCLAKQLESIFINDDLIKLERIK